MSFGAGMSTGFAAGFGGGIGAGVLIGRKQAAEELRKHIEQREIKLEARDGKQVLMEELIQVVAKGECAQLKKKSLYIALALGIAVLGLLAFYVLYRGI